MTKAIEKVAEPTKDLLVTRIAEITNHVMKLRRKMIEDFDEDDPKKKNPAKNPFVFWYSHRTLDMSCHLLGSHISAPTMDELLDYTEMKICDIYNQIYETNHVFMQDLSHDDEPQKWSQERLIKEYQKLQRKIDQQKVKKAIKPKSKKNEAKQIEADT